MYTSQQVRFSFRPWNIIWGSVTTLPPVLTSNSAAAPEAARTLRISSVRPSPWWSRTQWTSRIGVSHFTLFTLHFVSVIQPLVEPLFFWLGQYVSSPRSSVHSQALGDAQGTPGQTSPRREIHAYGPRSRQPTQIPVASSKSSHRAVAKGLLSHAHTICTPFSVCIGMRRGLILFAPPLGSSYIFRLRSN